MPFTIASFTNIWLEGYLVTVEVDANKALPTIEIIWLPDAAIKESKERIRASFRNIWVDLPSRKIILNLAPSDLRKVWTRFDVPMAAAILRLIYQPTWELRILLDKSLFFWELWLDWWVKKVTGILPSVISAYKKWWKHFFVPEINVPELQYIPDIYLYSIQSFKDVVDVFNARKNEKLLLRKNKSLSKIWSSQSFDFQDIKWHIKPKRALMIAAAGMHNVLMIWPPWSGKTMLAKALHSILPPLNFWQVVDVSQIYSITGSLSCNNPLITKRPFRCVHHTASKISIIGGGKNLNPWEVSLAHHWVLFFDELSEFPRDVLEVLRQPLEDKQVTISRAVWSVNYPADFMFVAAMNPCKCWFFKDIQKQCVCSHTEIKRYQSKISWPLLDRFDMIIEIPREDIDIVLQEDKVQNAISVSENVIDAWKIQKKRYKNTIYFTNSHISPKVIKKYMNLKSDAQELLITFVKRFSLSTRVAHKSIKLARTIADLQWSSEIKKTHIAEALQYRQKWMFIDS